MTIENIKKIITDKLAFAPQIGAKIKIDFGDDGFLFIDGTENPAIVSEEDGEAKTTFICSFDVLNGIMDGTEDPTMAFMTGKLKVQGSMGYALKLSSLLGD